MATLEEIRKRIQQQQQDKMPMLYRNYLLMKRGVYQKDLKNYSLVLNEAMTLHAEI